MSISPARYNFNIWRGATFHKHITLLTGDENSSPQDFDGFTALLEIRDAPDGNVIYTLSTANSRIELGDDGSIDLLIEPEDTQDFAWRLGYYDLILTGPDLISDPLLWGTFVVRGV